MKLLGFIFFLFFASGSLAGETIVDTAEYSSAVDKDLTIQNISLLPTSDNLKGIYAKAIDRRLTEFVVKNHRWNFSKSELVSSDLRAEDLVGQPEKVKIFAEKLNSDAFLSAQTRKDPNGLEIAVFLFSTQSGKLIAEERSQVKGSDTNTVLASLDIMLQRIAKKIPYDGLIMSRTDQRVTVNLGKADGLTAGQSLPIFKIISVKRHPKRDFIVKTNKALLGQVRIVKVDEFISFGDISSETEAGAVNVGAKVAGLSHVKYEKSQWTESYTPPEVLLSEDNKVLFGKRPKEWIPTNAPTFGKIGARFSLGSFNNNLSLESGTSFESQIPIYPKIDLEGELWLSPKWYINGSLSQGLASSSNPAAGGTPSSLNQNLSQYRMSVGYNFLLRNDFFGPKFSIDLGMSYYQMFVDNSNPLSFTTLAYKSFPLGIGGFVPVTRSQNWAIGGHVYFHLFPSLRETPFNSGDSDNTINQVLLYGIYKWSERIRLKVGMEALILSTSFSGVGSRPNGPAKNLSQRHTMLMVGADYMF